MLPIASEIATRLTRNYAQSALPDAPVVEPPAAGTSPRAARGRLVLARRLRRLADRVEPAHPTTTTAG